MGKRAKRWPVWKIAAATLACGVTSPALFWLATYAEKAIDEQASDPTGRAPILTVSSLVTVAAIGAGIAAVLGFIWLVVRIRDERTPAWKKKIKKRRF